MKYTNLDPLQVNNQTIELYRDGKFIVDIHNICTLQGVKLVGSTMRVNLKVTWKDTGSQLLKRGQSLRLIFSGVKIDTFDLEGYDLDDLGSLTGITLIDEASGEIMIAIASSIELWFKCSGVELKAGDEELKS